MSYVPIYLGFAERRRPNSSSAGCSKKSDQVWSTHAPKPAPRPCFWEARQRLSAKSCICALATHGGSRSRRFGVLCGVRAPAGGGSADACASFVGGERRAAASGRARRLQQRNKPPPAHTSPILKVAKPQPAVRDAQARNNRGAEHADAAPLAGKAGARARHAKHGAHVLADRHRRARRAKRVLHARRRVAKLVGRDRVKGVERRVGPGGLFCVRWAGGA